MADQQENFVIAENFQFAPFRTLNEFLLDARFELPQFNDLKKLNNRIITNFLYFQTNYFIVFFVLFFLATCYFGHDVVSGSMAVTVGVGAAAFAFTQTPVVRDFRAIHPYVTLAILVVVAYYCISQLPYVITLLVAIGLPLLPIFLHAALRLRNLNAKVNLEMENVRMRRTIMAVLLNAIGVDLK